MSKTDPFPTALTRLREQRGWSQNRLSAEAGYDSSYVCRLEAGTREPSRDTVVALCGVLGLCAHDTGLLLVSAGFVPRLPGWAVVWHGDTAATP